MKEEYFIFVGRIDKQKGIDILLEAWKLMGTDAPKLLICGTGPMEDRCKEYIEKNELTTVEMKGFVPNTDAKKLIANSKALILPTQWYEGFPMTIVEAYSVGTPVIGSDMGNVGSLIEEGVTGEKFEPFSTEKLVDAINRCRRKESYKVKSVYQRYAPEGNYRKMYEIYSDIVSDSKKPEIIGGGYRTLSIFSPMQPEFEVAA